jgi:hypothetical protein
MVDGFFARGWARFGPDPAVEAWLDAARPLALARLDDPAHAEWWRCGGTWFAGVGVLANDAEGRLGRAPPLAGAAVDFIADVLQLRPAWDPGQLSVTRPDYPRPWAGESEAAFRYRLKRDAAHVDGLRRFGAERRRKLCEPHGFILGFPITEADAEAAPLVVWEGSHRIMRRAFHAAFAGVSPEDWPELDITEAYVAARSEAFETCRRVPLPARPGEAILLHRLALHGVAPWAEGATAAPEGRAIAYFRPELPRLEDWLDAP